MPMALVVSVPENGYVGTVAFGCPVERSSTTFLLNARTRATL
jgi:hypothetical protein